MSNQPSNEPGEHWYADHQHIDVFVNAKADRGCGQVGFTLEIDNLSMRVVSYYIDHKPSDQDQDGRTDCSPQSK